MAAVEPVEAGVREDQGKFVGIPVEAFEFLMGQGPLEGCQFGERNPERRGAFWWRSVIRERLEAPTPSPTNPVEAVGAEAVAEALHRTQHMLESIVHLKSTNMAEVRECVMANRKALAALSRQPVEADGWRALEQSTLNRCVAVAEALSVEWGERWKSATPDRGAPRDYENGRLAGYSDGAAYVAKELRTLRPSTTAQAGSEDAK